jgi:UDP-N-acetylmuramate dehydrogenase
MIRIDDFEGEIRENEPLSMHTTWKVGGPARYLAFPRDEKDIEKAVGYAAKNNMPYYILGAGSNVLIPDEGIDGLVIKMVPGLNQKACVYHRENGDGVYFGAGTTVKDIMSFTIKAELTGLEFLAGIPASFGGILKMNAGAWGQEVLNFTELINVLVPGVGMSTIERKDLKFGYRRLDIPGGWIILGALVILKKSARNLVQEKITFNHTQRREKQPLDMPSCGSVFKNPPNDFAGRIIEELGLKGIKSGGAMISGKHANFIVNTGNATAGDILMLIDSIKQEVWARKRIILEEEVVIVKVNKK